MEGSNKKELITIIVTLDQKEAIRAFFAHHNWDLEIVEEKEFKENISNTEYLNEATNDCSTSTSGDQATSSGEVADDDNCRNDPQFCTECLSSPCVTVHHQAWLGPGQRPKAGNNLLRKVRYKKFWKMLDDRGLWRNPVYLKRKQEMYKREVGGEITFIKREIIPNCVLNLVRSLYPNPPGVDYMGHMW